MEGSGEEAVPPPQKMFLILEHGMAFSGAFWAGGDRYSDNRYSDSKQYSSVSI